jgi:hypothetical protein
VLGERHRDLEPAAPVFAGLSRIAWAAPYGAALGLWRGGEQTLYAALKLPLVLTLTWLFTVPLVVLMVWTLGARVGVGEIARGTLAPLVSAARLLGALAPVAALFALALPLPTPAARTEHNLLFLLHTLLVAAAGVVGVSHARAWLGRALAGRRAGFAAGLWVTAYALVGGEVAWAFRPFVGSVYEPIAFVRPTALDGNLYEFIVLDIAPHVGRQLERQLGF